MSEETESRFVFRVGRAIASFSCFFIVALLFFPRLLPDIKTHILSDDIFVMGENGPNLGDSDAFNSLWSYWWIQKAVSQFRDPYHCDWVYPPQGVNIFYHNQVLLPTILTMPVSLLLGTVAGYNVMVLFLLAAAAWVFYMFCRVALEISIAASAVGGMFFGFSVYFLRTAHAHPNMMGGWVWGGALACLCAALFRPMLRRLLAIPFAVFFWATFWTSLGEFFMLSWAALIAVVCYLLFNRRQIVQEIRGLAFFFMPVAIGVFNLLALRLAPPASLLAREVFIRPGLSDFFTPSNITLLGSRYPPVFGELDRCYLPISLLVLCAVAFFRPAVRPMVHWSIAVSIVILFMAADPLGIPSSIYRTVPMGAGMRFPSRFLPFAIFFLCIPAALGAAHVFSSIRSGNRSAHRFIFIMLLFIGWVVETYPFNSHHAAVRRPPIPQDVLARIDRSRVIWIIFNKEVVINDSYQVFYDMPSIEISHLARGSEMIAQWAEKHPVMYALNCTSPTPGVVTRDMILPLREKIRPQLERELSDCGVRYIFTEDANLIGKLPLSCRILWSGDGGALGELSKGADHLPH